MKSKNAEAKLEYYKDKDDYGSVIVDYFEAEEAVELAEADARERAVKAYCKCCSIPECTGGWKEGDYCIACQNAPAEFLKHYDND